MGSTLISPCCIPRCTALLCCTLHPSVLNMEVGGLQVGILRLHRFSRQGEKGRSERTGKQRALRVRNFGWVKIKGCHTCKTRRKKVVGRSLGTEWQYTSNVALLPLPYSKRLRFLLPWDRLISGGGGGRRGGPDSGDGGGGKGGGGKLLVADPAGGGAAIGGLAASSGGGGDGAGGGGEGRGGGGEGKGSGGRGGGGDGGGGDGGGGATSGEGAADAGAAGGGLSASCCGGKAEGGRGPTPPTGRLLGGGGSDGASSGGGAACPSGGASPGGDGGQRRKLPRQPPEGGSGSHTLQPSAPVTQRLPGPQSMQMLGQRRQRGAPVPGTVLHCWLLRTQQMARKAGFPVQRSSLEPSQGAYFTGGPTGAALLSAAVEALDRCRPAGGRTRAAAAAACRAASSVVTSKATAAAAAAGGMAMCAVSAAAAAAATASSRARPQVGQPPSLVGDGATSSGDRRFRSLPAHRCRLRSGSAKRGQ